MIRPAFPSRLARVIDPSRRCSGQGTGKGIPHHWRAARRARQPVRQAVCGGRQHSQDRRRRWAIIRLRARRAQGGRRSPSAVAAAPPAAPEPGTRAAKKTRQADRGQERPPRRRRRRSRRREPRPRRAAGRPRRRRAQARRPRPRRPPETPAKIVREVGDRPRRRSLSAPPEATQAAAKKATKTSARQEVVDHARVRRQEGLGQEDRGQESRRQEGHGQEELTRPERRPWRDGRPGSVVPAWLRRRVRSSPYAKRTRRIRRWRRDQHVDEAELRRC